MSDKEIALQLTLKMLDLNSIPVNTLDNNEDLNEFNEKNAKIIGDFYRSVFEAVSSSKADPKP